MARVKLTGASLRHTMGRRRKNLESEAMKEMRRFAKDVAKLAKHLAPEDTGALASAIEVVEEEDGRITVGIDPSTPYPGTNHPARRGFGVRPQTVGDYAERVMRYYRFSRVKRPGKGTLSKRRRARYGERTDGRFLYRAYHAIRQHKQFRI